MSKIIPSQRTLAQTFEPVAMPTAKQRAEQLRDQPDAPPARVTRPVTRWQQRGLPQPDAGAGVLHSRVPRAELFGTGGPQATDVTQGQLGDCYLLAALAVVAERDPSAIRDMIRKNKDGSYAVRFFIEGTPVWVRVDKKLTGVYAAVGNRDRDRRPEIWVALIEKAYVQVAEQVGLFPERARWGYRLIEGGYTDQTLWQITGLPARRIDATKTEAEPLLREIDGARMACAETGDGVSYSALEPRHAYSVMGTHRGDDGQTYVTVRNPWGGDNALVELTLAEFRANFPRVTVISGLGM